MVICDCCKEKINTLIDTFQFHDGGKVYHLRCLRKIHKKNDTQAYVICCNDSIEYVVINDEEYAKLVLDDLRKKDFERRKLEWNPFKSFEEYKKVMYWHIHNVKYQ